MPAEVFDAGALEGGDATDEVVRVAGPSAVRAGKDIGAAAARRGARDSARASVGQQRIARQAPGNAYWEHRRGTLNRFGLALKAVLKFKKWSLTVRSGVMTS